MLLIASYLLLIFFYVYRVWAYKCNAYKIMAVFYNLYTAFSPLYYMHLPVHKGAFERCLLKKERGAEDVSQWVECLTSMPEGLGLIPVPHTLGILALTCVRSARSSLAKQ